MEIYQIKLNKEQEDHLLQKTMVLFIAGYTPDVIAETLGQPVQRVNYWIALIMQAEKIYAEING